MKKITLLVLTLFSSFFISAQTDAKKVTETVSKSNIEGHIYFLASDELKGRETGTPEIDIAASYLANSFRRYNVKPANNGSYYQEVKLEKITAAKNMSIELNGISSDKLMPLSGYNINFNGDASI